MDMLTLAQMAVAARWPQGAPSVGNFDYRFERYPDGQWFVLPHVVGNVDSLNLYAALNPVAVAS